MMELPVDELWTYAGRNPRPHDFDKYWDSALNELEAVESDLTLEQIPYPSEIAECHNLWFTGVGGARVYAKYLRPKDQSRQHPGIVSFHGYSMSSADWFELLPFVSQGYSVLALRLSRPRRKV